MTFHVLTHFEIDSLEMDWRKTQQELALFTIFHFTAKFEKKIVLSHNTIYRQTWQNIVQINRYQISHHELYQGSVIIHKKVEFFRKLTMVSWQRWIPA